MDWKPFFMCMHILLNVKCDQCPPPTLKNAYAAQKCENPRFYHCLKTTQHKDYYTEICLQPEQNYIPGSYVIFENYINAVRCPLERYQPFPYNTNEINECIYLKSNCTEEGQIISDHGTASRDSGCRCDYTKGYTYVTPPKDPCDCRPLWEDCSCYSMECLNKTYELSQDYECEVIDDHIRRYRCRQISPSRDSGGHHELGYNVTQKYSNNVDRLSVDRLLAPLVVTGIVCLMIAIFIGWFAALIYTENTTLKNTDTYLELNLELNDLKDRSKRIFSKTKNEYVRWNTTSVFEKSKKALENNSIVILKGRKGTGKTTLAMHLASGYINRQCKLAILDKQNANMLTSLQKSNDKYIIILEEWFDTHSTETTGQPTHIHSINTMDFKNEVKIIITVTKLETNDIEKMSLTGVLCEDNLTNLDEGSAFCDEFKKSVLSFHMTKHARELSEKEIERIVSTETYYGFPLECSLFCSILMNFNLGSKYYRQPSVVLMDEINALRNSASENKKDRNMYSVMVYMLLNHENGLNITDIDIEKIEKIASQFNSRKGVRTPKPNISDAWREMAVKYLQSIENKNEYFLHPVVYQAVLISYAEYSKSYCKVVLENCNLLQLLDVVRPSTYEQREGEMVLSVEFNKLLSGDNSFCPKMTDACLSDETEMHLIFQYIKRYHVSILFQKIMKHLETKMKNPSLTEQRVDKIMKIFEEIMDDDNSNDKNLDLLEYAPTNFALTWAIIVLQKSKSYNILETLVDRYLGRIKRSLVVDILRTVVDEHGNSVLHYCILWWEDNENPFIIFLSKDIRENFKEWIAYTDTILTIRNINHMSPLEFAAFFCNHAVAKMFVGMKIGISETKFFPAGKLKNVNKEIDTLLNYAGNGDVDKRSQNCTSYPWINMNVCGNIHMNDTFDFDQTFSVLKELQNSNIYNH